MRYLVQYLVHGPTLSPRFRFLLRLVYQVPVVFSTKYIILILESFGNLQIIGQIIAVDSWLRLF